MKTTNNVRFEIVTATGRNLSETERNNIVSTFDLEFFWMKDRVLSIERMKDMIETKRAYFCKRYDERMKAREVPKESVPLPNKSSEFRDFFDYGRISNMSSGTSVRISDEGLSNIRSGKVLSYTGQHTKYEHMFESWYWVDWNVKVSELSDYSLEEVEESELFKFLFDKSELPDFQYNSILECLVVRAIKKIARKGWKSSEFCSLILKDLENRTNNVIDVEDIMQEIAILLVDMINNKELSAYYGVYPKQTDNSDKSDIILVFDEYESVLGEDVRTMSTYTKIVKTITNFAGRCQTYNNFAGKRLYIIKNNDEETEYFDKESEYLEKLRDDVDFSSNSTNVVELREEIGHIGRFYHKMAPEYHEEFEYWLIGMLLGYNLKETAELYNVSYKRMLKARDLWQNGVICQKKGKKYRSEPLFKKYVRKYRKIK